MIKNRNTAVRKGSQTENILKTAFTLAEVLITLTIVGVVAAMTLPALIQNINDRVYAQREGNISFKINQAMEQMRAHGLLNYNYSTTEAFVDELEKYLKIAKRCSSSNIAECWPTSKVTDTDGKEYEVSKAKTGKDLQLKTNTNNVGLILADGAAIILNYDPNSKTYDVGDQVTVDKDSNVGGYYKSNLMLGIAYVTDINGKSRPNSQLADKKKDIRSFNGAKFGTGCDGVKISGIGCFVVVYQDYDPITDRSKSRCLQNTSYCNQKGDSWQAAVDKCKSYEMDLPNLNTFQTTINSNKNNISEQLLSGWWWTSDEHSAHEGIVWIATNNRNDSSTQWKYAHERVLCLKRE